MKYIFSKVVKRNLFVVVLILILISITVLFGTYAWFTWSSTDNTSLTLTIGNIADIAFANGNQIDGKLNPVFDYTDGLSTSFEINNKVKDNRPISYNVYFNITNVDSELKHSDVKYILTKNDIIVKEDNMSSASNSSSIMLDSGTLTEGYSSFAFYLYIDSNVENQSSMMNKSITGSITVDVSEVEPTPLSSFTYVLGSEASTIDMTQFYDGDMECSGNYVCSSNYVGLNSDEVLLIKYNGSSTDVVVPNTYVVDGNLYNVVLLSNNLVQQFYYPDIVATLSESFGVFMNNDIIDTVALYDGIKFVSNNNVGYNDTNTLPGVNSANYLFYGCSSLTNVRANMYNVTDMAYTFYGCTNLTGTINIKSSSVSSAYNIFSGTSLSITVRVLANSTTQTTLEALTTNNGMPSNITLVTY